MTVDIRIGDVFAELARLDDDSVDIVVTSPPYWGLRDYGVPGQIGLEPTLGEHLDILVRVFAEIWRVLKPTGTVWLNYGDCYATKPNGKSAAAYKADGSDDRSFQDKPFSTVGPVYPSKREGARWGGGNNAAGPVYDPEGGAKGGGYRGENKGQCSDHPQGRIVAGGYLKPKDLVMAPARLAIALQEFGWWVRSEIVWAKPNPMPESIKDRPGTSHEKIFLLTKSPRYFYDHEVVRQKLSPASVSRLQQDIDAQEGSHRANGGAKTNGTMKAVGGWANEGSDHSSRAHNTDKQRGHGRRHAGFNDRWDQMTKAEQHANGRSLRNYEPAPVQVWVIATRPFGHQFCTACGTFVHGSEVKALKAHVGIVGEKENKTPICATCGSHEDWLSHFATFPPELVERCIKAGCPEGGLVLDPFGGAATTGLVADRLQRSAILIELNPQYAALAQARLDRDRGGLLEVMEA